jgi:branched-chain amino acid transport system substrate-binding protein
MRSSPARFAATLVLIALAVRGVSAAAADGDYDINAVLPLTGSGSSLGTEQRDALRTIEVRVNNDNGISGRHIHFVVSDDRSDPALAAKLAADLAAKHVPVILGSALSANCNAMQPAVVNGPLLFCLSPDIVPPANGYTFASSFATRDLITVALRYIRARNITQIAIVSTTDPAGLATEHAIDEALASGDNRSLHVVAREHLAAPDADAVAQMTRVKASGAQITIAWIPARPLGTVLSAMHDAAAGTPVLTSNENLTYDAMKRLASVLPNELLFPAAPAYAPDEVPDKPTRATVEAFLAEFSVQGVRPDNGQSLAWDPAQLVLAAFRSAGLNATAAQVRSFIAEQRNWIGINGSYNFRAIPQRGLGPSGVVIVRWDATYATWAGVSRPGGLPLKADTR